MGAKNTVRIGKALCNLMSENKIKVAELAEMADLGHATISRARRNEKVERLTAKKIFDVFGVEYNFRNVMKKPKKVELKEPQKPKTFRITLEIKAFDLKDVLDKMIKIGPRYINLLSCFGIEGNVPVFRSYALEYLIENEEKMFLKEWLGKEHE